MDLKALHALPKAGLTKTLRIMKITAIILLSACLTAGASGYSQKVTISEKNARLEKVFTSIRQQTGYEFLYTYEMLENAGRITIELKSVELQEALNRVFSNQPLTYSIIEKTIVVKPKVEQPIKEQIPPPPIDVTGRVTDSTGQPLSGASIRVRGTKQGTTSDNNGFFFLKGVDENATIEISYQGFELYTIKAAANLGNINLRMKENEMDAVTVEANTGYQKVKPNEANGSIVVISNKILNEQKGTNILQRLNGVTSGLYFNIGKIGSNTGPKPTTDISINGLSTINGPLDPLIIVDNFPYEGDIKNINPIDIEDITILRDAAAASIWGAKAGNGVIVITTKRGKYNQKWKTEFNTTMSIINKPDVSSISQISSSDYVGVEEFLFTRGYYDADINSFQKKALTPVVDVLYKRRRNLITSSDSALQINALKQIDGRKQYDQYFLRNTIVQQYSLNMTGGTNNMAWLLSGAYDTKRNDNNFIGNKSDKVNLRVNNVYRPLKKMELNFGVYYTNSVTDVPLTDYNYNGIKVNFNRVIPYLRLADDNGMALPLAITINREFTDTAASSVLLDWRYYPLEDYKHNRIKTRQEELLANLGLTYEIVKGLRVDMLYQYEKQRTESENLSDLQSFRTRNLVNTFYQRSTNNFVIPKGGIIDMSTANLTSKNFRTQFNFNRVWNKHSVSAIVGGDIREVVNNSFQTRVYGYNANPLFNGTVDYVNSYTDLVTGFSVSIPGTTGYTRLNNRFVSLYGNMSYNFKSKYTLSGSIRRDGSNIFGANTNNKWRPLWSIGAGWEISKESFFNWPTISYLKLRTTYGFSGNLDVRKTASPIALVGSPTGGNFNFPFAFIQTINNPELRWEKLGQWTTGLEFSTKKQILSGSVEYYIKTGTDLYGSTVYDYTTWGNAGTITKNVAAMKGYGINVNLTSRNIYKKFFKWTTQWLVSYNNNKTTQYNESGAQTGSSLVGYSNKIRPIIGKPLYSNAAYKWGGLNAFGDPIGYLNGQPSTDYLAILIDMQQKGLSSGNVVYIGPSNPTVFGSIINRFSWKQFSFALNISCRFGYYFQKPSFNYNSLFSTGIGTSDFADRWQKPGDELTTNVPAMVYINYPNFDFRDNFYSSASINYLKADNIRLQYMDLDYSFVNKNKKIPFEQIQLSINVSNIGILWRANKENFDPDYPTTFSPPQQFTTALRARF